MVDKIIIFQCIMCYQIIGVELGIIFFIDIVQDFFFGVFFGVIFVEMEMCICWVDLVNGFVNFVWIIVYVMFVGIVNWYFCIYVEFDQVDIELMFEIVWNMADGVGLVYCIDQVDIVFG